MIKCSTIATALALISSVVYGFRPSYITEVLLWGACVIFVYERDYER